MAYSILVKETVNTGSEHTVPVIVTAIRTKNDVNGNPRYLAQVWVDRSESFGNVWAPNVKGYRRNKDDQYSLQSYDIHSDIFQFLKAFEQSIQAAHN